MVAVFVLVKAGWQWQVEEGHSHPKGPIGPPAGLDFLSFLQQKKGKQFDFDCILISL